MPFKQLMILTSLKTTQMKKTIIHSNLIELSFVELQEINGGGDCPDKAPLKDSFFSTIGCGVAVVTHKIGEAWDTVKSWF
jgi:hypothetical protein